MSHILAEFLFILKIPNSWLHGIHNISTLNFNLMVLHSLFLKIMLTLKARKNILQFFSILPSKNRPKTEFRTFCLNLRIADLETLVAELTKNNITVKPMEVHPEEKFAWIADPDNNWIELWEDTSV